MQHPFEIIFVEDQDSDAELLEIQLKKLELDFELIRVENSEQCLEFLDKHNPDLVISDYNLPGINGLDLLIRVRDDHQDLPFILISGYIGEEKAVDAMRKGASDYVLKDNPDRLVPAVQRELLHYREHLKTESERDEAIHKLKERVKEQKCLYKISSLNEQKLTIEQLIKTTVKKIPQGWQYPQITEAEIEYDGKRYQTKNYKKTEWCLTGTNKKIEKGPLLINVVYLERQPEADIGPFIKEESHLINSIVNILTLKISQILDQQVLEQKQRLIEEERDRLLEAQRIAEMGDWYFDIESGDISWSPILFKIFERSPDLGEPSYEELESYFQYEFDHHNALVENALNKGMPYSADFKIYTNNGNEKYIHVEGKPEKDEHGNVKRLYGTTLDITKRKKAETALQKSEQRLKSLVRHGLDLIAILDDKGFYKYVASTKHRINEMGREIEEYYGKSIYDILHPDYHDLLKKSIKSLNLQESISVGPFQYQAKNGEWRWMVSTITNLSENPAIKGYVANSRDVTKAIERERKLRDIVEYSTNMFYRHDRDHVLTYVSPQSQEFLGLGPEETPQRWSDFLTDHPSNRRAKKITEKALQTGEAQEPYEMQLKKADGEIIWVRVNEAPVVENGETVAMVGSLTDITARKEYEEKLERLSLVASKTTDIIIMTDVEERITWVNDAYVELTGYTLKESIGKIPGDFLQGEKTDPETVKTVREAIQSRQSVQETILNYSKDGRKYWLDMKIDPIFENGECTGFIAIERDVTERREAYEKLVNTEQKLREIVEHSTNLFFKHDINHQLEYISPQSKDYVGLTPDEAMKKWTDLITDHPANEIGFKKTMKAIETGKPQGPYELQFKHIDGGVMWARVHEAPIVKDGETIAIVGSLTDITEQKKYEERLEELSLVASKTTDVIIMTDAQDKITWVNNAFENIMGYSLKESIGKTPGKLLRGSSTDLKTAKRIEKAMSNQKSIQEVILNYTKDGRELWLDMTADPIFDDDGEFVGYIAINKDVTEKISQSRKLQESVERFEVVTKATSDTIWDADLIGDTVRYNYNIKNVFGYDLQEEVTSGEWWVDKIHPEDRKRVAREFELAELKQKERLQIEYRFQDADGSYRYVNDRAFVILNEDGKPIRMIGAMQDITKQKEENLWLKLLESAITNTTEAIAILEEKKPDTEGRKILYVNNAFEQMTGFTKDDILGDSLLKFVGPITDRKTVTKTLSDLEKGKPSQMEVAYYNKEGKECWAQISFAPVRDSKRDFSHWICIGRDTTERRKKEFALRESLQEKETLLMEIHHRVKNNLAVVSSLMHLQAMQEEDESLQKKLYDSVARIRTMVTIHELLYESQNFAKINFSQNLERLVSAIIETIQNEQQIHVEYRCCELELNVNQAIPCSLIVNEVVTNAIKHAFTGKDDGHLFIEVEQKESSHVIIRVSDDGKGLPENVKNKEASLGMQLINVLAEQMDADYQYKKALKGGTIFEIQFEKSTVKGIGNAYLN